MTSFEALIYHAAFNLTRRTVVGAGRSEEGLAGAWRGLAQSFRAGRDLIEAHTTDSTPEAEPRSTRRARKS
jgi:hypothetical protein